MIAAACRAVRLLRSRRLAVTLIALFAVYGIVGTVVPRGAADAPAVRAWAANHPVAEAIAGPLGLHRAYASPLFLALGVLLAATTAACAVERTRRAHKIARGSLAVSDAALKRLREHPQSAFRIGPGTDPDAALVSTASSLADMGLKVRSSDNLVDGRAGVLGLLGSPLFHWSLVALMFAAAAGQATRSEGFLALPVGQRIAESHAEYFQITEGPLFRERHTGLEFEATKIDRSYTADGVDFGVVPSVTVYRDDVEVTSGDVYPNNPLKVGSLMVHMSELGPSVTLSLESSGGAEVARDVITLDRSTESSSGTTPYEFTLNGATEGQSVGVRIQVVVFDASAPGASGQVSRAIVETATAGSGEFGPPVLMIETQSLDLAGGQRLRIADVGDWVRVSVTNDWSVPYIYAFLVTAILGLALAVLVPARRASVLLVPDGQGHALHVGTWHSRRDPLFKKRVLEALERAAGGLESG